MNIDRILKHNPDLKHIRPLLENSLRSYIRVYLKVRTETLPPTPKQAAKEAARAQATAHKLETILTRPTLGRLMVPPVEMQVLSAADVRRHCAETEARRLDFQKQLDALGRIRSRLAEVESECCSVEASSERLRGLTSDDVALNGLLTDLHFFWVHHAKREPTFGKTSPFIKFVQDALELAGVRTQIHETLRDRLKRVKVAARE
jgi:hypothetical protein